MVKNAKLGGVAKRMRDSSPGQTEDMLPRLVDLVDAPPALDSVRRAVLTRAITHHEGSAAVRAIAEFVKACSALATKQMMDETTKELEKKDKEILELRAQLSGHPRVRVAR
jgi:hypothetical protein